MHGRRFTLGALASILCMCASRASCTATPIIAQPGHAVRHVCLLQRGTHSARRRPHLRNSVARPRPQRNAVAPQFAASRHAEAMLPVLHNISASRTPEGELVFDTDGIGSQVVAHYSAKWRCGDADAHDRVDGLLAGLGDVPLAWSASLRHADRVDASGMCALALQLAVDAAPEAVLAAVSELAALGPASTKLSVRAVALRNKSSSPVAAKVRMLLPLGAWMAVLDALLAAELHKTLKSLPPVPGFWERAVAGTAASASYLAHWARLLVEKGLDCESRGAVLFTDVRTFYDCVNVTTAVMAALAHGLPAAVGAAAIRHQLLSHIDVVVSDVHVGTLARRGIGALTGSRVAGALGRVVIRSLAEHLHSARGRTALRMYAESTLR